MQWQAWKKILPIAGVTLIVSLTLPVLAQNNPPASTYQPGYWQPIARVNPNSPLVITLVNQTKSPLKYNFLDDKGEKDLPVGVTTSIKVASLPVNLAIYDPSPQAASGKGSNLRYETVVNKNDVQVVILPTKDNGFSVLNIAKTGAIYAY